MDCSYTKQKKNKNAEYGATLLGCTVFNTVFYTSTVFVNTVLEHGFCFEII